MVHDYRMMVRTLWWWDMISSHDAWLTDTFQRHCYPLLIKCWDLWRTLNGSTSQLSMEIGVKFPPTSPIPCRYSAILNPVRQKSWGQHRDARLLTMIKYGIGRSLALQTGRIPLEKCDFHIGTATVVENFTDTSFIVLGFFQGEYETPSFRIPRLLLSRIPMRYLILVYHTVGLLTDFHPRPFAVWVG